jgi:hypothetical protein
MASCGCTELLWDRARYSADIRLCIAYLSPEMAQLCQEVAPAPNFPVQEASQDPWVGPQMKWAPLQSFELAPGLATVQVVPGPANLPGDAAPWDDLLMVQPQVAAGVGDLHNGRELIGLDRHLVRTLGKATGKGHWEF